MNCVFRIPISSRYSPARLAINASVSLGESSGLKPVSYTHLTWKEFQNRLLKMGVEMEFKYKGTTSAVQGKRNRRVVVLLEGVMAVSAEVHPDLIEVLS